MNTKSKISRSRRGKRRTHQKVYKPQVRKCPNCSSETLSHTVCFSCGFYRGRQVLSPKTVEETEA